MANLQSETLILGSDSFTASATPLHRIGTRAVDKQGRVYRYARAGASDLVAGNVLQSAAIIPNHLANTPPVVALGANTFTYTPGNTAAAVGFYENGFMQVDTTPGNGYTYGVDSHPAIVGNTAFAISLKTDEGIQIALTASSRVGLSPSLWRDVIQFPVTTATGSVCGVAVMVIPATQYGWVGTWGRFSVLIAGTPALGAGVMTPSTVAGSVAVVTTTNLVVAQYVGNMAQVGVDTKNNFVDVKVYP